MRLGWVTALLLLLTGCEKIPFFHREAERTIPPQAGLWFHYGTILHSMAEFPEAAEAYQMAVKLNPDFFEAWRLLQELEQVQGKSQEQIQALQQAIRLKPQSAALWSALAEAHDRLGQKNDAIHARQQEEIAKQQPQQELADLEAETQAHPNSPEAWTALLYYHLMSRPLSPDAASPEATKAVQSLAELLPDDASVLIHQGLVSLRRSSDPGTESPGFEMKGDSFQKAVQRAPEEPLVRFLSGRALLWAGKVEEAAQSFQEVVRLDPKLSIYWCYLGEAHLRLGRGKEALEAFQESLNRSGQRAEAWYGLSEAQAMTGMVSEAVTSLEKGSSFSPSSALVLSSGYYRNFRRTRAQQRLQSALRPPSPSTPPPPLLPRSLPERIEIPVEEMPPREETLEELLQKAQMFPKDIRTWRKIFELQEKKQSYAEMTETATRLVTLDSSASNWALLAYTFGLQDRREEEIKAYLKSLEKQPDQPEVLRNLGLAFLEFQKPDRARETFEKWTHLDESNPEAWYHLGLAADLVQDFSQAEAAYRQVVRMDSRNAKAWLNLGAVYGALKKRPEEIQSYQKAVAIDPNYAAAWYNLSVALKQAGKKSEAEKARSEYERLKR